MSAVYTDSVLLALAHARKALYDATWQGEFDGNAMRNAIDNCLCVADEIRRANIQYAETSPVKMVIKSYASEKLCKLAAAFGWQVIQ